MGTAPAIYQHLFSALSHRLLIVLCPAIAAVTTTSGRSIKGLEAAGAALGQNIFINVAALRTFFYLCMR
ncbi:MAG: hypothetical protein ACOY46_12400 [Bacillota bacterium]